MRKLLMFSAAGPVAAIVFTLLLPVQQSHAAQRCVAIMEVVGVSPATAEAANEDGEDENGDGAIWINNGGGKMTGYIDCSDQPGAKHGDTYQQNAPTGKTRKTGNDYMLANLAADQMGSGGGGRSSSSSTSQTGPSRPSTTGNDDGAPNVPGKKKPPIAKTQ